MLLKKLQAIALGTLMAVSVYAQEDHTLLTIGDNKYSAEEFDFIYTKNNNFSESPKSKKEYIDLFINYKLKVAEAVSQGLDTMPSFTKEFTFYKKELAKPYLTDQSITDQLMQEAYAHLKEEVDASHILLKVDAKALPQDTLAVYNKMLDIKRQAEAGADFGELAKKYSQDPSAKQNKGRLGYFKGFMMVYPFEKAAYDTEVGQLSEIARTSFGYHLIKVHDKRPDKGELLTSHIMLMFAPNASATVKAAKKAKIDSVYQLVLRGDDFGALATSYSEDRRSAVNNGQLPWFSSGRMVPEFSKPAFELDSVNNISKVIETPYGYHIIKLLDQRGVASFEEMQEEIKGKIKRDERANKGTEALVNRLKVEYNYSENEENIAAITSKANDKNLSNEDFLAYLTDESNVIFTIADTSVKTYDLVSYILAKQQYTEANRLNEFDKLLSAFVDERVLAYEESQLETKFTDYKYLVNEYHDGLLIFEVSQSEIWNKANEDSVGIANYYQSHKEDYFVPEQITGEIAFFKSKKQMNAFKKLSQASLMADFDSIKSLMVEQDGIKLVKGQFARGDFKTVDAQIWKDKKSEGKVDKEYPYSFAKGKTIPKEYKEFEDTKGQVIADYQTKLEEDWLVSLKTKFAPVVNKKALKYIKN